MEEIVYPLTPMTKVDPRNDGVDHINIWSRGRTKFGRWLSNFAYSPFTHPTYGWFASMEAYYYYIATGSKHEGLRKLFGREAKMVGKTFPRVTVEYFEDIMMEGIEWKALCNPFCLNAVRGNYLRYTHYFYFGQSDTPNIKIIEDGKSWWLMCGWEEVRRKANMIQSSDPEKYISVWWPKVVNKTNTQEKG